MTTITFEEYCEDYLDLNIGLMSELQIIEARAGYQSLIDAARAQKPFIAKHPDMKLPIAELRARCERLVSGQRNAVAKFSAVEGFDDAALGAARAAVAHGEALLSAKRPTKAEFIAHAAQNSDASRLMNAATRSL